MSVRLVMEWHERDGMPRVRIAVVRGGTVLHGEQFHSLADVEAFGALLQREMDETLEQARWRFLDFAARRSAATPEVPHRIRLIRG
jgi:hypothetical protein